jgi:hypothetical protein
MGWDNIFAQQDPQAPTDPTDFIGQQAQVAKLQILADAVRKQAQPVDSMGSMVSGHYVPNFAGFGQQLAGNLNLMGANNRLIDAQMAEKKAELSNAQQLAQSMPQRNPVEATETMGTGDNGQELQGPPRVSQGQTFNQYQQALGAQAAKLLANPMTADMGKDVMGKLATGSYDQTEQARLDRITAQQSNIEAKRLNTLFMAGAAMDRVNAQQAGATGRNTQNNQTKIDLEGLDSPKQQVKNTLSLSNSYQKTAKPYTDEVDQIDGFNNLYAKAQRDGLDPSTAREMIDRFQRTINPGRSVQSQQYKSIQNQMPAIDQIALQVDSVFNGNAQMTPALMEQMNSALQAYGQSAKQNMYQISNQYATMSHKYHVDPNDVIPVEAHRDPSHANLYAPPDNSGTPPPQNDGNGGTTVVSGGSPMPTSYKDPHWDDVEIAVAPDVAGMLKDIRMKGEKSNSDQVSSAQAKTPYQITASTRNLIQQKYGYDAWSSPENAVKAAAQVYRDGLAKSKGDKAGALDHYSGGASGYANRVLTQTAEAKAQKADASAPLPTNGGATGWKMVVE